MEERKNLGQKDPDLLCGEVFSRSATSGSLWGSTMTLGTSQTLLRRDGGAALTSRPLPRTIRSPPLYCRSASTRGPTISKNWSRGIS